MELKKEMKEQAKQERKRQEEEKRRISTQYTLQRKEK